MLKNWQCLVVLVLLAALVYATDAEQDQQRILDTIQYGIETQVVDLVAQLRVRNDDFYNTQLHALLLASRSASLKIALLDFFAARKAELATAEAVRIITERFDTTATLVQAAFNYLIAIQADAANEQVSAIINGNEAAFLQPAIRLAAESGDASLVPVLVELYAEPDTITAVKEQILLALGKLPAEGSFTLLSELLSRDSSSRIEQMYAATGLGNLGDARAIETLQRAAFSTIPEVRARAIDSLSNFDPLVVEAVIIEALKDAHVQPRLAACQAVGRLGLTAAIPFLGFRIKFDPERVVREAAIAALGRLNRPESFVLLIIFLEDTQNNLTYRSKAFLALVEYASGQFDERLDTILEASMAERDKAYFNLLARGLVGLDNLAAVPFIRVLLAYSEYAVRLNALAWAERNVARVLRPEIEPIAAQDSVALVKNKAIQVLARFDRADE
ncbi:MAG: hypothetical protein A2087_05585 [Spirochaetes bacterium GWD1_61_31]|nr:MAG: hypothetical protein A2Y37_03605 [Spirochaetes bacterium GWB1_60_80]OHD35107.1 MAG: hypothetical protein A2004_05330 [Spirochaetes bacterium GWC1_61_12]OHD43626.1 MAG: hypothetical protein A2087_05585 [Spirochaetes bacterium GWD1_61_31]OHD44118.1 MAG: hypothetical protein A2Y35_02010 [Spirochaetes bacterium GWE1_60_18]OHD61841.1 MAG: hypothetical protein A2Y32_13865 [Spirochaetes bacterium GWF1_60_12]HAW85095.1 hypothetical protein [Spirochaetaceae bacterium]